MLPPLAFSHVGLTVPDIFGAIEWCGRVLGFTLIMGPRMREADVAATHETPSIFGARFQSACEAHPLTANGIGIELFQVVDPPDRHGGRAPADPCDQLRPGATLAAGVLRGSMGNGDRAAVGLKDRPAQPAAG